MKKNFFLLLMVMNFFSVSALSITDKQLEAIGKEFRMYHPFGYQTVGLKHVGDDCVFVISEPSNKVTEESMQLLFQKYEGRMITQSTKLGYDGWMKDIIGSLHFSSEESFEKFKSELFYRLYGTDYKAYFTDLDKPNEHVYYSPYKLNYSISAAEISKWIIDDKEVFVTPEGTTTTIPNILSSSVGSAGMLLESKESGFVAWIIRPNKFDKDDHEFLVNARKFAIDTDLIIGAFGNVGKNVAIIARKRNVPMNILPPLRIETIELLCNTRNLNLAQSYERYHVFAGKTKEREDVAPIYLSNELWNTEYGNLLNVTDQMLKSWSENGRIEYKYFEYPKPIDWAFNRGAVRDFNANELTYNWNTAGAGYVLQGNSGLDIFAVNRTGSLPVSYIPDGMEGKVDQSINDAEELAYDFFSNLNNPDLVRVVQYATLYQIVTYFYKKSSDVDSSVRFRYDRPTTSFDDQTYYLNDLKNSNDLKKQRKEQLDIFLKRISNEESNIEIISTPKTNINKIPQYKVFEPIVERLLHFAETPESEESQQLLKAGFERFIRRTTENGLNSKLSRLIDEDPYGEFKQFLSQEYDAFYVDSILNSSVDIEQAKHEFNEYLNSNLEVIKKYIADYIKQYGTFPFDKSAHYLVSPRELSDDITIQYDKYELKRAHLSERIDNYNKEVERYNKNEAHKSSFLLYLESSPKNMMERELAGIRTEEREFKKYQSDIENKVAQLSALSVDNDVQKAVGALNWLLTDPQEYNEPFGGFFTDRFKDTGSVWLKSPTIACSYNGSGYGGHNLDSHATPIKFAEKIPTGKCRVTKVDGNHVISVAKENWSRITPEVLRSIERKDLTGLVDLPKAPQLRSKDYISYDPKGPNFENNGTPFVPLLVKEKGISINGEKCNSVDDMVEVIHKQSNSSVNEIRIREYTEREVLVSIDGGTECVLERSVNDNFSLTKYDNTRIVTEELADGNVMIKVPQKEVNKRASFGIEVPKKYASKIKDAVLKLFSTSKDKINNVFKFKRELKMEIGNEMPDFEPVLILNEIMNTDQVQIIIENDENIFLVAA